MPEIKRTYRQCLMLTKLNEIIAALAVLMPETCRGLKKVKVEKRCRWKVNEESRKVHSSPLHLFKYIYKYIYI